ncbi:hypothetical protein HGT70_14720 [Rosenbergiella collisarenosi]|uniref:hypothetical protein n=1 Tax=Rosenbergiella collisarenosi TaxID=1544695 RepID=UPI001BDB6BEE|nr:hypothetical protein [Rosenbergiella collisarenosi]MBT0722517.1 hypothetical protein [Rosenbergiella collisarenosi]
MITFDTLISNRQELIDSISRLHFYEIVCISVFLVVGLFIHIKSKKKNFYWLGCVVFLVALTGLAALTYGTPLKEAYQLQITDFKEWAKDCQIDSVGYDNSGIEINGHYLLGHKINSLHLTCNGQQTVKDL